MLQRLTIKLEVTVDLSARRPDTDKVLVDKVLADRGEC